MKRYAPVMMLVLAVLLSLTIVVTAQESIRIGDYVQMGTYYDKPILWRCVDIDEHGPLMLSDKIICEKAYDASGSLGNGSHNRITYNADGTTRNRLRDRLTRGSDYWGDSNMRSWLNSDASAGNVEWLCQNPPTADKVVGNSYADEAGFLTNFTENERRAMKPIAQKTVIHGYEHTSTRPGNIWFRDGNEISEIVGNYDTAYHEVFTDTVFIPDVKQIYAIYENFEEPYYGGIATAECLENSSWDSSVAARPYWIRNINTHDLGGIVFSLSPPGGGYDYHIGASAAHAQSGVRPAFYMDLSSVEYSGGSGTAGSPYTIAEEKQSSDFVKDLRYENNTLTADISLDGTYSNATAYLALYEAPGILTGVSFKPLDTVTKEFEMQVIKTMTNAKTYYVKFMIWNDGCKPVETVEEKTFSLSNG